MPVTPTWKRWPRYAACLMSRYHLARGVKVDQGGGGTIARFQLNWARCPDRGLLWVFTHPLKCQQETFI